MRRRIVVVVVAVVAMVATVLVVPPAPAEAAGFSCRVTGTSPATVTWTDVGAKGYDIIQDDQPKIWWSARKGTRYVDRSPGRTYRIVAWGNGQDGRAATCTNANPGTSPVPPPALVHLPCGS